MVVVVAGVVSTAASEVTSAASVSLGLLASIASVSMALCACSLLVLIERWIFLHQPLIDLEAKIAAIGQFIDISLQVTNKLTQLWLTSNLEAFLDDVVAILVRK